MQDATRPGSRSRASAVRLILALVALAACVALAWSVRSGGRDAGTTDEPSSAVVAPEHAAAVEEAEVVAVGSSVAPPTAESARTSASAAESPEAAGPLVELLVSTRESLMPDAKFVPDIAIAGGLGAPFDATRAPLVAGRTGADGSAKLALPWSAIESARARGDALWLRVVEPGYQQRTRTLRLPDAPGPKDYTLIAFRGCTLRGRVLDGSGAPVAAKVRVAAWISNLALGYSGLADARADGWFEALPFRPGTYEVLADAGDSGTGALRGLQVSADRVPDPIEIVVSGPGVVRGHVSDGAGHAAAGMDLDVVAADYDRARDEPAVGNIAPGAVRLGELELEGRGRVQVDAVTDANGMFEVRGLRADGYVVRVRGPRSGERGAVLTAAPVASDGIPLELVLARPHLAVHVVDEHGVPWTAATAVHAPTGYDRALSWPSEARVGVLTADPEADLFGNMSSWSKGKRVAPGEFVFEVPAGRSYRVGLIGGNQPWAPLEVSLPEGSGRVDVRLVAAAAVPSGSLLVDVTTADGAHVSDVAIRIEDPRTGIAVVDRDQLYDAGWPQGFSLPEGDYRVVVDAQPQVDHWEGEFFAGRAAGRFEAEVRVVREQSVRLSGTLPAGARIAVRVSGAASEADRAAIRDFYRGFSVGWPNWEERFPARVQLVLRAENRWPIPVEFVEKEFGPRLTRFLALGAEDVSQILPAGRFTLEARLPGGRVARAPVELVDGRTTEVALAFD